MTLHLLFAIPAAALLVCGGSDADGVGAKDSDHGVLLSAQSVSSESFAPTDLPAPNA